MRSKPPLGKNLLKASALARELLKTRQDNEVLRSALQSIQKIVEETLEVKYEGE